MDIKALRSQTVIIINNTLHIPNIVLSLLTKLIVMCTLSSVHCYNHQQYSANRYSAAGQNYSHVHSERRA